MHFRLEISENKFQKLVKEGGKEKERLNMLKSLLEITFAS